MRNSWIVLAAAVTALGAQAAAAQDQAPPGCRWQDGGETLACEDGHGYWRRSGDGEIVGVYAVAKPKPKPVVAPRPQAAAAAPPAAEPAPPPPTPQPEVAAAPPGEPAAAQAAPPAAVVQPAPPPRRRSPGGAGCSPRCGTESSTCYG
jgi:hypothetical protein